VRWEGRTRGAHRVAWTLTYGPIPKNLCVLHHCDNKPCCNPAHLFLGTKVDNARDMIVKGRQWQQLKTHCPQGHPYSGDNLLINPTNGGRQCRTCIRGQRHRRYVTRARAAGAKPRPTTHCSKGHPFASQQPGQQKKCQVCLRESQRRYYARNRDECNRRSREWQQRQQKAKRTS
jgi:hypothetical protein